MARWQRSRSIRFSHRLETLGLRAAVALFQSLGHRAALRLGAALGSLAYRLGVRRAVALENVRRAQGLAPPGDETAIARATYRNLGRTFAEYARLPRTSSSELRERIRYDGIEHLESALDEGRGVVAVSGHFGSLELMAASFRLIGRSPTLLVAPMRNPLATAFLRAHRAASGLGVIEVGPGLREAFRVLRGGGLLCLAADQDAGRHGIFVDFLGRPASTATGAVELAMRTGAPIVFGLCFREGEARHHVVIRPPLHVGGDGSDRAIVAEHVALLSAWLEEGVRRRPDHWFWLHRRWKTEPARSDTNPVA